GHRRHFAVGRTLLGAAGRGGRHHHPGDEYRHPCLRLSARIQPHRQGRTDLPRAHHPVTSRRKAVSGPAPSGPGGSQMSRSLRPLVATAIIFIIAYSLAVMQFPGMFSTRVLGNFLTDNAFLGIAAVGMTFVILSGGIDLSVGAVIGFTGV